MYGRRRYSVATHHPGLQLFKVKIEILTLIENTPPGFCCGADTHTSLQNINYTDTAGLNM